MTDLWPFVGRFHPLLVHFPIGILVLAAGLQLLAWRRARGTTEGIVTLLLGIGAATAALAATTGYMLGTTGDYAGATYTWHLRMGVTVAAVACWTTLVALVRGRQRHEGARDGEVMAGGRRAGVWVGRVYAVSVAALIAALIVAGHLGATLTHGEEYLTERAPAPLRTLLARMGLGRAGARTAPPADVDQALVYATLVEPVLAERCVVCHGAAKAEGGLRLDTPDGLRKGGEDGPVIVAGKSAGSELVRRVWLPASHADVMPPRGHRPLTPAEASLVRWWIDQGARFDLKMADAQIAPDVQPAIEAVLGPISRGGPTMPRVKVGTADAAALAKVRQIGVSVVPVADGTPFLHVHCTNVREAFGDAQLAALEPIAPQLLWLDLSGTRVTDAGLATVEKFPHLTRLHLNGTPVTDAGVAHLTRLARLEYLNLYDTRITDEGLARIGDLKNLRALYVWKTAVTQAGVDRLKTTLPRVQVEGPLTAPDAPASRPSTPTR